MNIKIEKYSSKNCIPCKSYKNTIEIFKFSYPEIEIEEIEDNQEIFSEKNIRSVPTTIFYKDNIEICRLIGVLSMSTLEDKVKELKAE